MQKEHLESQAEVVDPVIAHGQKDIHRRIMQTAGNVIGVGIDVAADGSGIILNSFGKVVYGAIHAIRSGYEGLMKNKSYKQAA